MRIKGTYIAFLILSLGFIGFSCKEEKSDIQPATGHDDEIRFDVNIATRVDEDSDIDPNQDKYFLDGESVVFISQRATNLNIDFTPESTNCYKYYYSRNDDADWEHGFNFKPVDEALNWGTIIENGQFGQVFAFAILYFPGGDKDEYPYKVGANQNEPSIENEPVDFFQWDILGGYHRTGKVRDRLRFQLKHLMCRLKVNLYVPKVNAELGNGYEVNDIIASALSFRTDYTVSFGDLDSEGIPMAQPTNDAGIEIVPEDIRMKKTLSSETTLSKDILSNFNVSDLEEDDVYQYSFDMIFPAQSVTGDILRFTLQSDGGESNFLFNSNNLTAGNTNFKFEAGSITKLELYLRRSDNTLFLLEANIDDWNEISTGMVVVPDEGLQNQ